MIFLDSHYWSSTFNVIPVLKQLFGEPDFSSSVLVTDSIEETVQFLERNAPAAAGL